jgi:hypothetical protein
MCSTMARGKLLPAPRIHSPSTRRVCSIRISSAMLVRDRRTSSANGTCLQKRRDNEVLRLVTRYRLIAVEHARLGHVEFAGSTSPIPPQTSQRRRPVPSHSLQFPVLIPTMDILPVP